MKYLNLFEKYIPRKNRKSISNKNPDIEEINYLLDGLRDFGFKIFISIHETGPSSNSILKYCNGYIYVDCKFSFPLKETSKKERKDIINEVNDILEELNDRIEDTPYLFFNKIGNIKDRRDYFDHDKILMEHINIGYYLFLQSGFKKGTKFKIPDPVYF